MASGLSYKFGIQLVKSVSALSQQVYPNPVSRVLLDWNVSSPSFLQGWKEIKITSSGSADVLGC